MPFLLSSNPPSQQDFQKMKSPQNPDLFPDSQVVLINGSPQAWKEGWAISEMLIELGAAGPGVAVERNGEVVRKSEHSSTFLAPGDQIEVLRLVGGG